MNPCPFCDCPMPASRRVQCGAPDCSREYQRARVRKWQHEFLAKQGHWPNRDIRKDQRKSNASCVDCSAPVRHGRSQQTRCRKCAHRANAARQAENARLTREAKLAEFNSRPSRAARQLAVAAAGTIGTWPFAAGRCHSCGSHFACRVTNTLPKFCSNTCAAREAKLRRRALEKGCQITPGRRYATHERDDWRCGICGDPVSREASAPELDAPVIDHIIPLARGGSHAPENWQTAHFYCNSVKRDQLDFDFAEVAA